MAEEEVEVLLKRINIKSKKKKLNPTEIRSIVRSIAYLLTDKFLEDGEKKTILCDALGGKMSAIYDYGQRQKDEGIKEGIKEGMKEGMKERIKKNG